MYPDLEVQNNTRCRLYRVTLNTEHRTRITWLAGVICSSMVLVLLLLLPPLELVSLLVLTLRVPLKLRSLLVLVLVLTRTRPQLRWWVPSESPSDTFAVSAAGAPCAAGSVKNPASVTSRSGPLHKSSALRLL